MSLDGDTSKRDRKHSKKYKLFKIVLVTCILISIFIIPIGNFIGIDWKFLKRQYPGFPFLLNGICLFIVGILGIIFRDECGLANADFRRKIAEKFPAWKKMSGLPEDQVEYYLSVKFNRKIATIGAVALAIVGASLIIIGCLIR